MIWIELLTIDPLSLLLQSKTQDQDHCKAKLVSQSQTQDQDRSVAKEDANPDVVVAKIVDSTLAAVDAEDVDVDAEVANSKPAAVDVKVADSKPAADDAEVVDSKPAAVDTRRRSSRRRVHPDFYLNVRSQKTGRRRRSCR